MTSYESGEYTVIIVVLGCTINPLSELRRTRVSLNVYCLVGLYRLFWLSVTAAFTQVL